MNDKISKINYLLPKVGGTASLSTKRLPPTKRVGTATHQRDIVTEYEWRVGPMNRGGSTYYIYHLVYETVSGRQVDSERTNMAIISSVRAKELLLQRNSNEPRPSFCIRIESEVFCNIHGGAHGGNGVSSAVQNLEEAIRELKDRPQEYLPSISWVILGDYNRDPRSTANQLEDMQRTSPSRIVFPTTATHISDRQSTLDYMITNTLPSSYIPQISVQTASSLTSDHTGVFYFPTSFSG